MPVYEFRCDGCGRVEELVLPLGETGTRPCPACAGELRHRLSRVGVRYGSWGFRATDKLVDRPGRPDYKRLRDKADQISDE